jgi:hypothetical protein
MDATQALASRCSALITGAEKPNPFSSRDGKLLKLVPAAVRLGPVQLRQQLHELLQQDALLLCQVQLLVAAYLPNTPPYHGRADVQQPMRTDYQSDHKPSNWSRSEHTSQLLQALLAESASAHHGLHRLLHILNPKP